MYYYNLHQRETTQHESVRLGRSKQSSRSKVAHLSGQNSYLFMGVWSPFLVAAGIWQAYGRHKEVPAGEKKKDCYLNSKKSNPNKNCREGKLDFRLFHSHQGKQESFLRWKPRMFGKETSSQSGVFKRRFSFKFGLTWGEKKHPAGRENLAPERVWGAGGPRPRWVGGVL